MATAIHIFHADVGVPEGRIAAPGEDRCAGCETLGAAGGLALCGGVEAQRHIEQEPAAGIMAIAAALVAQGAARSG